MGKIIHIDEELLKDIIGIELDVELNFDTVLCDKIAAKIVKEIIRHEEEQENHRGM